MTLDELYDEISDAINNMYDGDLWALWEEYVTANHYDDERIFSVDDDLDWYFEGYTPTQLLEFFDGSGVSISDGSYFKNGVYFEIGELDDLIDYDGLIDWVYNNQESYGNYDLEEIFDRFNEEDEEEDEEEGDEDEE